MNVLESRMTPSPGPVSTGTFPRPPTFNSWSTWLASTQQTCLTNSFKIPINNPAVNHNSEGRSPFSHALVDLERPQVIIQASSASVAHANLEGRPPHFRCLPEMPPDKQRFSERLYLGMRIAKLLCLVDQILERHYGKAQERSCKTSSVIVAELSCSWESLHTPLRAESQEQTSEGPQFPGPGCYMAGQGETGQEAGFQISAAFSEVQNFIFCGLLPTQNLSVFLCVLVSLHQHVLGDISILLSILRWLWHVQLPDCN